MKVVYEAHIQIIWWKIGSVSNAIFWNHAVNIYDDSKIVFKKNLRKSKVGIHGAPINMLNAPLLNEIAKFTITIISRVLKLN